MFHVLETSHYLCTINHQPMNIDRNIKVGFMPEADEFLYSLPYKVYQKVVYNIHKVEQGVLDKELFKNLMILIFGSSVPCSMVTSTVCLPFGTLKRKL